MFGWQKTGYKTQILLHVEYFKYTFMKTCLIQTKTAVFEMIKNKKKSTIEKLLNELFTLEGVDNEQKMEAYAQDNEIKIHM